MESINTVYKYKTNQRVHYIILKSMTKFKEKAVEYAGLKFKVDIEQQIDITEIMFYSNLENDWEGMKKGIDEKPKEIKRYYINISDSMLSTNNLQSFIQDLEECDYSQIAKLYLAIDNLHFGTYNSDDYPVIKEIYLNEFK